MLGILLDTVGKDANFYTAVLKGTGESFPIRYNYPIKI